MKGDIIEQANNTNVVNDLSGKVAGVQVTSGSGAAGGSSFITIRGNNSILGDNQPLFVVDGVPIDNSQYLQVTLIMELKTTLQQELHIQTVQLILTLMILLLFLFLKVELLQLFMD